MAIGWFIVPYKWGTEGAKTIRYSALADFSKDIKIDDGDWTDIEIDDDKSIAIVRASNSTLTKIGKGSDVAITPIDDPKPYWKPTRISTINGVEYENRTLEDVNAYFFDDQGWGNFKALAETIAGEYNTKQSYLKIAKGEWRVTAQLLVLLSKAGYTLDKISTGTFPTVSTVLDDFNRANATTVGAGWTMLCLFAGAGDWGISGNALYNPDYTTWAAYYINAGTYGPDAEAYLTWATIPADQGDSSDIFLRTQEPGDTFDGYSISKSVDAPNHYWNAYEYTNHVGTKIGAADSVTQAIAAGEKMGADIISRTITGYLYTGAAWSTVITRTDAGAPYYDSAGYIGLYIPGNDIVFRFDNLIGGTVITAGGVPIAIYKKYYDYRRSQ